MRNLGYVDGQNVSYVFRFAEGDFKKLPLLATELVNLQPDVIVTTATGADAAPRATTTIPIVVGPTSEEMLTRLVGNLGRPIGKSPASRWPALTQSYVSTLIYVDT